ncbi:hypothetical protein K491DRAFT_748705 [Lophiostoma macrostomum CBS 122681]|uniref:Alpha/beta hydrolase fold-3 domain-containing protein n=1 Tax=Lophiostoma macrostomum CBS 122681 TaxID=1314788 RepID=A0A6A6T6V6_9PLEO|nr:hypothetical protein K491DRAFT_748705 [Lophiostoma macrostomum CBS 122681]
MAQESSMELMLDPSYVNPELAEILEKSGPVPGLDASTDIHELRKTLLERKRALTAASAPAAPQLDEVDHTIPTRDGNNITVRIYSTSETQGGPVLVMLHGGGWVLGGLDNEALLCRDWVTLFRGVAINVDYRLAPEVKFPVPVYDSYDAILWTAVNQDIHGGDLRKGFIIAGISAGASMASTITHLARDERLQPPITGCYLSIPSLLAPQAVPETLKKDYLSREQHKDAPILGQGAIALFRRLYEDDPTSPLMSSVLFPSHANIPSAYFQVAGMDPLRDEGLIYERILREESNVATKLDLYPGLPHGFWSWWPKASFSQQQHADSLEGFRWLLESH